MTSPIPFPAREQFKRPEGLRLPPGGGGPTFDGMDERVAKLEVRTEAIEGRLDRIEAKLDRMTERLDGIAERLATLPTRDQLLAIVGIALAAALAFSALTFQIADYAAKQAPAPQPAAAVPPPQPTVIVIPGPYGTSAQIPAQGPAQVPTQAPQAAPAAPSTPTPPAKP